MSVRQIRTVMGAVKINEGAVTNTDVTFRLCWSKATTR